MKRIVFSVAVGVFVLMTAGSAGAAGAQPAVPQPGHPGVAELGADAGDPSVANGAVVGGTRVSPGEAPYVVSLRDSRNFHFCGGSILDSRTIVTAGHCVYDNNIQIYVYTGSLSISGGSRHTVQSVRLHPAYSPKPIMNDVAVLILDSPIEFGRYVQPVPLATDRPVPGTRGMIAGWGQTGADKAVSQELLKAEVSVIDGNKCREIYGSEKITDNHLCTFAARDIGPCMGDSGGPFIANGQLAGIISWGRPCAVGYPDVYTSVHSVYSWINTNRA
ncbi:serine protease [Nocardia acidivorans]|uniref:serine protease n=1 Tax=Nocardia acidivorans TaxID=404580 RepID=UPI00082B322A|nr:serine protease [Nocardia acidivorans]